MHQILVGIGDLGDYWCRDWVLGRRLVRLQTKILGHTFWFGTAVDDVTNVALVLWSQFLDWDYRW